MNGTQQQQKNCMESGTLFLETTILSTAETGILSFELLNPITM